jgi:hypothetical protein
MRTALMRKRRKAMGEAIVRHKSKKSGTARGRSPGFEALCAKAEGLDHALRWDGMGQGYTLIDAEGKEVCSFFNLRDGHEYLKSLPIAAQCSKEPSQENGVRQSPRSARRRRGGGPFNS